MPRKRNQPRDDKIASAREARLEIVGPEGPAGCETNPVTIPREEWGQSERNLVASVRDGLRPPSQTNREPVLRALQKLAAKDRTEWHFPGQIAPALLARDAQPTLEQLVEEGLVEHAVRASGWRCLVYRLAVQQS